MKFEEEYFTSGSYQRYMDRADRTHQLAREIKSCLQTVSLFEPSQLHVDYGCGPGFLVEGLCQAGYQRVLGFDISWWAVQQAQARGSAVSHTTQMPRTMKGADAPFMAFGLDVLEHIPEFELRVLLQRLRPRHWLVRIPLCHENDGKFVLSISESDPTHVIRWTEYTWLDYFDSFGYELLFRLNLYQIWSSKAVLSAVLRERRGWA